MNPKKAEKANSKPQRNFGIDVGYEILDTDKYQSIPGIDSKLTQIMDLDAIQRAKFAIRDSACEDVIVA